MMLVNHWRPKMKRTFALILVLAACLAAPAAAEVPALLNYQGVLADASGVAVPDNAYSITFKIYDVPSGGSELWTETNSVIVSKGTFSVTLGYISDLKELSFDTTYYIGMSVEGGSELPRQILTPSPYSLNAKTVRGSENVFPADGKVGIGTLSPSVPLNVTSASGQVGIQFDGNDDYYSSIYVNAKKAGASAGYGYELQGGLRAYTFVDPSSIWNLQLVSGNYALRASQAGNVCIGLAAPGTERLRIDGGLQLGNSVGTTTGTIRWSGSDFEGYNGSAWQSFTATGGGPPPGSAGQTLRHDGSNWVGASNLYNDGTNVGVGTTSPEAMFHVNGDARIGSSTAIGSLGLYRPGIPAAVASLSGNAAGGEVSTYDENFNLTCAFKPSFGGEGGMLGVTRNTDQWGLFLDGNFNIGQPYFYFMGDYRGVIFDLSQSGDQSVWLPYESVSSSETSDEPGVASYGYPSGISLAGTISIVASQSITTPGSGYVLVIASSNVAVNHTNGVASHAVIGTSDDLSGFPENQDMFIDYPATAATGAYLSPATCHGLYYNAYPGTYTYYLLGIRGSGAYVCYENQLSLIYIPTMYGTVQPTLASAAGAGEKTIGAALTAADVASQKIASEAANAARMRRELDELRAEVDAMKAKLGSPAQARLENK
jgi:hypothetical protein